MGGKSVTASERKGILAVAAVTLLVAAAGLLVSRCDTAGDAVAPAGIEVVHSPGQASTSREDTPVSDRNEEEGSTGQEPDKKGHTSASRKSAGKSSSGKSAGKSSSGKSAGKSSSGKSAGKTEDATPRSMRDEPVPLKKN